MLLHLPRLKRSEKHESLLIQFAQQFETIIQENRELQSRLKTALDERERLNQEIASLAAQVNGRLAPLLQTREKLMRDEFERSFQELTIEVKQERARYVQLIQRTKSEQANCICRGSGQR
jgi:hypothetical protein